MDTLLQDSTNVGIGRSTAKDIAAPGTGCVSTGTADKRSLAAEMAESNVGDRWRDFLGAFKELVR